MNRLSILTNTIGTKKHITVYVSDGITITERAGSSIIKTIIRTYAAHLVAQWKYKQTIRAVAKGLNTETINGCRTGNETDMIIQTESMRITRFKSRVDGAGKAMQL